MSHKEKYRKFSVSISIAYKLTTNFIVYTLLLVWAHVSLCLNLTLIVVLWNLTTSTSSHATMQCGSPQDTNFSSSQIWKRGSMHHLQTSVLGSSGPQQRFVGLILSTSNLRTIADNSELRIPTRLYHSSGPKNTWTYLVEDWSVPMSPLILSALTQSNTALLLHVPLP